ncbi:unnamed protein product [Prorocentrum cordatum]|uniref:Uncharacterized protein n=1 Tax=Prorocentrum cordatum TaxID=2364126 RepID=A0ABN9UP14_9DINO|nr:unnamed protein product [Polarella glacialis]
MTCGNTAYRHLHVFVRGRSSDHKTELVSQGVALSGFRRPCKAYQANGSVGGAAAASAAVCEAGELALEVPPADARTVLELSLDKEGLIEPPAIQPAPSLSYDRRVLQATLQLSPGGASAASRPRHTRSSFQTISVRYTCFKDGVSDIMLTLHVLAHKPIDLAWRKRCVEPKAHVGKALTAPQAFAIVMVVLVAIGFAMCLVCFCCSEDDDPDGPFGGAGGKVAVEGRQRKRKYADEGDEEALEGMGPAAAAIGAREGEITYH